MRLICHSCKAIYASHEPRWLCDCGGFLSVKHDGFFDPDVLKARPANLWRYRESLPIETDESIVSFYEGFTPIVERKLGNQNVLLKLDFLFPTGSFKDRGTTVMLSKIRELGIRHIAEDSSGNAGCSVAAYAAAAGIDCDIYIPSSTSRAKVRQIEIHGACIHSIPGPRSEATKAVMEAVKNGYYASHTLNPYFLEGTKTFAFEVWEQLKGRLPESWLIPTGNGTLLLGAYLGCKQLKEHGLIESLPRLCAVQSESCAPLRGLADIENQVAGQMSLAEGIAIAQPPRLDQIRQAIEETGGEVILVSNNEIAQAQKVLGQMGIFVELTAAVGFAAAMKGSAYFGWNILVPLTGHGLKSSDNL